MAFFNLETETQYLQRTRNVLGQSNNYSFNMKHVHVGFFFFTVLYWHGLALSRTVILFSKPAKLLTSDNTILLARRGKKKKLNQTLRLRFKSIIFALVIQNLVVSVQLFIII